MFASCRISGKCWNAQMSLNWPLGAFFLIFFLLDFLKRLFCFLGIGVTIPTPLSWPGKGRSALPNLKH